MQCFGFGDKLGKGKETLACKNCLLNSWYLSHPWQDDKNPSDVAYLLQAPEAADGSPFYRADSFAIIFILIYLS